MDTVSNMLVSLKNAYQTGLSQVNFPYSKQKAEICRVLKETSKIVDFTSKDGKTKVMLNKTNIPVAIRRVSSPGARIYVRAKRLPRPRTPDGVVIVSTPKGMMTNIEARKQGLGGEVICEIN